MKLIVIASFMALIVYNLFAGLYYMMRDRGGSDRMVQALTRRIALSVGLIALLGLSMAAGWIQPHGIGG